MQDKDKNLIIVEKMIKYCEKIDEILSSHKITEEVYLSNDMVQLAIDMCIFQLTELSIHIDDAYKIKNLNIPWAELRGMRNIHGHDYDSVDREIIWDTIEKDIPELREKLKLLLK